MITEPMNPAPPSDRVLAGAFARYPYAEAFFSWRNDGSEGVVFYSRTERRPPP